MANGVSMTTMQGDRTAASTAPLEAHDWRDDETRALAELTREFVARELSPRRVEFERQQHVDRDVWRAAGALGLLCCSVPEEYGGAGGTFAHDLAVEDALSLLPDTHWQNVVHSGIVAHYLLAFGTEEQKRRWLPGMVSGDLVAAIAMTEPGTGSDLQAVRTRAVRDGDDYVIDGAKTFISNGALADFVLLVARTGDETGHRGISLIGVETAGLDGFARGRNLEKLGGHGADTGELFYDGARVPVANLLGGREGAGFAQLMQQLPQERLLLALRASGMMETAVKLTVDYTRTRTAFGKPLFEKQNTRFVLADAATKARWARVFVDDCVRRHLAGDLDAATASMAKWWATDLACQVVDECLQMFGGYGYITEYPIARMYADVRVLKIVGGSNEIMKELVARSL